MFYSLIGQLVVATCGSCVYYTSTIQYIHHMVINYYGDEDVVAVSTQPCLHACITLLMNIIKVHSTKYHMYPLTIIMNSHECNNN